MKIKRLFLLGLIIVGLPIILSAQSNIVIDNLLGEEKADWGQSAYLVLTAAQLIDDSTDIQEVPNALEKQQWNVRLKGTEEYITLGEYSYMLMKAFNIPGGIMYKIFPGLRYAARELGYLHFIDNDKSPYRTLSGEEVVRIMGRVLEWKEAKL